MNHVAIKNITGTDWPRVLYGMVPGQDARVLAQLTMAQNRPVVHIASDETRVQNLEDWLGFFAPTLKVIALPGWDCLPYDRVSPSIDNTARRLHALAAMRDIKDNQPAVILASVAAATQYVMPRDRFDQSAMVVTAGSRLASESLIPTLIRQGYRRVDTVREPGDLAKRGSIIDVFVIGAQAPVRLDLWGDTIESLRSFDAATQMTTGKIDQVAIVPASEYDLDPSSIARFRDGYRAAFGVPAANDVLYSTISEGRAASGAEHWLPLFYESMATVFDYVPETCCVTFDPQYAQTLSERADQIKDYYSARQSFAANRVSGDGAPYHPLPPGRLYLSASIMQERIAAIPQIQFESFAAPEGEQTFGANRARDFADVRAAHKHDLITTVRDYLAGLKRADRCVAIACYTDGSRDRLAHVFEQAGVADLVRCADVQALMAMSPGRTGLIMVPLDHGFIANDLAILTEQDILGDRLVRGKSKRRRAEAFIHDLSALHPGDTVVHQDHGIGRFDGLETIRAAGTAHDCLKLIYAGGDRLFLPVENMELISRFGGDSDAVELDKLGGVGWQSRKARVKKNLMAMAEELLAIAAERATRTGEQMVADSGGYGEFIARFPYQETDEQQNAIDDVLADLARGAPADRLVCGDVGFGKTEVALRAAYVVASSGAQVAVVVPTTLLARQHARNFVERFKGLGIEVAQLSRMVTASEKARVKQGLANGRIGVVIGTHALLAKDIKFCHLGLMIVDEEQRFGVKQKEALKALKNDVHVLTLTATPIPRTLQMALTGVRDMSMITTAPVDRLPIRTAVLPFDPLIIREAILRERHRGGQTFYVCPRISDLADVAEKLRELVPEVRVVMAHGQLAPTDLEDRMSAFYDGQYDVLLATNIIESGIDIPTANTMIVHRADRFGLAQLYQIRGRIGRAKVRAHAYLTYDPTIKLNATAQKRLEVIEMLDTLGSGFQLASYDLDIRGAGNLLGDDQSGHIREVGVELYQQMLEDAVTEARARRSNTPEPATATPAGFTPAINLGASILIPEAYVADLTVRLWLYRRLAALEERADLDALAAEMVDRFGPLPPEGQNLLDLIELKIMCRQAGVDRVDAGPQGAVIGFYQDRPPKPEALMAWVVAQKGTVKLRPDQRIQVPRVWPDVPARMNGVRMVLTQLAEI